MTSHRRRKRERVGSHRAVVFAQHGPRDFSLAAIDQLEAEARHHMQKQKIAPRNNNRADDIFQPRRVEERAKKQI